MTKKASTKKAAPKTTKPVEETKAATAATPSPEATETTPSPEVTEATPTPEATPKPKAKTKKVKFLRSPTGAFGLAYSAGDSADIVTKLADDMIAAEYCEVCKD